jgi:hypothetical protein
VEQSPTRICILVIRLDNTPNRRYTTPMNITTTIIAYENGELDEQQTLNLFQVLISTGLIHDMQGSYQRTAQELIDCGRIF